MEQKQNTDKSQWISGSITPRKYTMVLLEYYTRDECGYKSYHCCTGFWNGLFFVADHGHGPNARINEKVVAWLPINLPAPDEVLQGEVKQGNLFEQ